MKKIPYINQGFNQHFILVEEFTEEIRKAERDSYEQVVRMMSHEINNSVGSINSILSSILSAGKEKMIDKWDDYCDVLDVCRRRNQGLVNFTSNIARVVKIPEPNIIKLDLINLLQNCRTLFSNEKEIVWKEIYDNNKIYVWADKHQIEQVLVNIIKNAIEALETKGWIQFEVIKTSIVKLVISNNGRAIELQNKDKIFSPFFSTRKNGQGLGLMLVKEVLLKHDFNFSLDTDESGVTNFIIEFKSSN